MIRKDTLRKNVPRSKNGRMIWSRSTKRSYRMMVQYEFKTWREFFMKSSMKIYKIDYTIDQSIKRYKVSFMVSINRESRLWKENDLGTRYTSSTVDITLDNWFNQSRRINQTTYMVWDSLQRTTYAQKDLYKLIRHLRDSYTYSYMRILRIK